MASSTVSNSLPRDAHHVADDQERERLGERLDEVDLPLLADVVDDLGADRSRPSRARLQLTGGEGAGHDPALAGVARVVHGDERSEELHRLGGHVEDGRRPFPEQKSCGRRLISTSSVYRTTAWKCSVTPAMRFSAATGTNGPDSRSSAKVRIRSASGRRQKSGSASGDLDTSNSSPCDQTDFSAGTSITPRQGSVQRREHVPRG